MREHVFKESDKDKDRMISYDEFLAETQRDEYNKDEGWDTLDEAEDIFTEEEYNKFEHQRQEEVQKMVQMGQMPQGYPYPNIPAMPPVGYGHPGGYPQGYPQPQGFGPPMPGMDRNGVPMHGSVPGQPAHPQFVPGLPPNQQPGYVPPQQFQGQPMQQQPLQQQQFQRQPPQGQPIQQQPIPQQPPQQQQFQGQPQQQFQGQPPQQQAQPNLI